MIKRRVKKEGNKEKRITPWRNLMKIELVVKQHNLLRFLIGWVIKKQLKLNEKF